MVLYLDAKSHYKQVTVRSGVPSIGLKHGSEINGFAYPDAESAFNAITGEPPESVPMFIVLLAYTSSAKSISVATDSNCAPKVDQ